MPRKKEDPTAAERQTRRRDKLKEAGLHPLLIWLRLEDVATVRKLLKPFLNEANEQYRRHKQESKGGG